MLALGQFVFVLKHAIATLAETIQFRVLEMQSALDIVQE